MKHAGAAHGLRTLFVASLVLMWSGPAGATGGNPENKTLRCKYKIAHAIIALGKKQMRVRADCAARQALGQINSDVNCLADPVNGISTGSASVDFRLKAIEHQAESMGQRIARRCDAPFRTPETVEMAQLCEPPATDHSQWPDLMTCGYELIKQSSDNLSAMIYRGPASGSAPMTEVEALCRLALNESVRSGAQRHMRKRSDCFEREEKTGEDFDCMAIVAWPGRVERVGFKRADLGLVGALTDLKEAIDTNCSVNTDDMRFSENASIIDPTVGSPGGATFTTTDLYSVLTDAILTESMKITLKLFPQDLTYCGDGFIDTVGGEECDDGNQTSCDGCDRDCTLPACLNGSACGPDELCDDGNTKLEDGCNTSCQPETCGDSIIQLGLGEGCDDGNTVDCDGCDSNCSSSTLCNNGIICPAEQCDDGLGICLSGFDEFDPCVNDTNCRGECITGKSIGDPCFTNTDCTIDGVDGSCKQSSGCGGRCDGGANANRLCSSHQECPGKCQPVTGKGQVCTADIDCPLGMRCNFSSTCELPRQGVACEGDGACGEGGFCELSGGCTLGNSDTVGDACRDTCTLPECGDSVADRHTDTNGQGGEECDDGNDMNGDGCDVNCTETACGNGIVTPGEDCDEGHGTCAGGYDANAACLLASQCRGFCFDDPGKPCTLETAAVDCDGQVCFLSGGCLGGNADSETCRPDCSAPKCGDGHVDPGEQCDAGPGACVGGVDAAASCFLEEDCRGICITGTATGFPCLSNTDCAPGVCDPATCVGGNSNAPNTCRDTCLQPACGDNVKDSTEACDGTDDTACPGLCSAGCACP
jgi:cysteine-rich repeat protein